MGKSNLRILLSGMLARVPGQGGAAWVVLQYLLGLRGLGHEVQFVESLPTDSLDPAGAGLSATRNAGYFRHVIQRFGLAGSATLVDAGTRETIGLPYDRLRRFAQRCDLLINLSGLLRDHELMDAIPLRVYVDIDPGFTQLWRAVDGIDVGLSGHNRFVTIGMTLGQPGCPVPTGDIHWIRTVQPLVLEHWPMSEAPACDGLTTIANWRGYGSVEFGGRHYGQKAHSWRKFFELPAKTGEQFKPALAIHPGEVSDLEQLERWGWRLADPASVAATPEAFRSFVQGSKAEFGIAKSGYVEANCGWFSDRSICYLASGRPVIAQETGFSDYLPTGVGLMAFETEDDVLRCIRSLNSAYDKHRKAARQLAEDRFDARKVLSGLLGKLGAIR